MAPKVDRGSGSDFLQLGAAAVPARGVTGWLTATLRASIADARLVAGTALPPTRLLAAELGISRGVVVEAYRRLVDEGLLTGRPGSATVVSAAMTGGATPTPPAPAPDRWRLPLPPVMGAIDLSPGVPDLAAFPRAAWLRAERRVLQEMSAADLGYGDPRGNPRLRAELSRWLARVRGVRVEPDGVLVVAGWPRRWPCSPRPCAPAGPCGSASRTRDRAAPGTS